MSVGKPIGTEPLVFAGRAYDLAPLVDEPGYACTPASTVIAEAVGE